MQEQYSKWYSSELGKETEMLIFGHSGFPMILFPTSMGRYYQNKDFGLIDAISWYINQGLIMVYCPDSLDSESWYNKSASPPERVSNHLRYERMILSEVISRALNETQSSKVILSGCSFGGYHAANLSFKYPQLVSNLFSMSGAFNIRNFMDGFYDESVYFNNPMDYLPNLNNPVLYEIGIILGTGSLDNCLKSNLDLSSILSQKNIPHWLDNKLGAAHDWPVWKDMLPHYLSLIHY